MRGSGWRSSDFFLGVELSLAALASALMYIFDLAKFTLSGTNEASQLPQKIVATASFLVLSFFLLLWVISTHQDWEQNFEPSVFFYWNQMHHQAIQALQIGKTG